MNSKAKTYDHQITRHNKHLKFFLYNSENCASLLAINKYLKGNISQSIIQLNYQTKKDHFEMEDPVHIPVSEK